jgi:hypothetical protein
MCGVNAAPDPTLALRLFAQEARRQVARGGETRGSDTVRVEKRRARRYPAAVETQGKVAKQEKDAKRAASRLSRGKGDHPRDQEAVQRQSEPVSRHRQVQPTSEPQQARTAKGK